MDKIIEFTKSQKDEEKLLIAKILDKIKMVEVKNRPENTDFLDLSQKSIIQDILLKRKQTNYNFFGGYDNAERTMLIIYPSIFEDKVNFEKIYDQIISVLRITLPKELQGTFEHKTYLGAIMKLGVKREKVGDIIVRNDGADIIISKEIEKFLISNLTDLTRFKKSQIEIIKLREIKYIEKEKDIFRINVPSMRLDAIVGEIAKTSRNNANLYINQERVFVNFKLELRNTKQIIEGDIITIRGKGRFTISKIIGKTKSNRINLEIQKW